ncbi:probable membrane-associated kinase regulator 1 [Mercurialis annua]|uniref:probable membrane-associated kinase regulator 1 n=1 Tax=Mercurialis annua TaxID=3986 RepID=UPI00215E3453|nr:probable membrane-associated kinase regulator 1 [Mercurialis annua]
MRGGACSTRSILESEVKHNPLYKKPSLYFYVNDNNVREKFIKMGKNSRREKLDDSRSSQTLPSSPSHSFSSSSDFEFTVSLSPRKSSTALYRPADELFYKGQLLPLHLSPRISMVRTLLLASSSTSSSSDTNTTASRDSTGSSNDSTASFASDLVLLGDCDSSRPSSVTEFDDEFKKLNNSGTKKNNKYFSLSRFSSVFKPKNRENDGVSGSSSVKRMSTTAREVIRKYLKKVKPLYEKLSQKQQQKMGVINSLNNLNPIIKPERSDVVSVKNARNKESNNNGGFSHSFSGNLRYPRRRSCVSSCPSSMRSSPSHSGVLCKNAGVNSGRGGIYYAGDTSSMEELQSAIQGAIAHCKNSMVQNKSMIISNEI